MRAPTQTSLYHHLLHFYMPVAPPPMFNHHCRRGDMSQPRPRRATTPHGRVPRPRQAPSFDPHRPPRAASRPVPRVILRPVPCPHALPLFSPCTNHTPPVLSWKPQQGFSDSHNAIHTAVFALSSARLHALPPTAPMLARTPHHVSRPPTMHLTSPPRILLPRRRRPPSCFSPAAPARPPQRCRPTVRARPPSSQR